MSFFTISVFDSSESLVDGVYKRMVKLTGPPVLSYDQVKGELVVASAELKARQLSRKIKLPVDHLVIFNPKNSPVVYRNVRSIVASNDYVVSTSEGSSIWAWLRFFFKR